MPAWLRLVYWLDGLQRLNCSGHFGAVSVTCANRDFVQFIEHVQLSDNQCIQAVDHRRVAQQRDVEPAAAARASRYRPIFVARFADTLAHLAVDFGWEWTATHARDV